MVPDAPAAKLAKKTGRSEDGVNQRRRVLKKRDEKKGWRLTARRRAPIDG
jgi:hypothetical protein